MERKTAHIIIKELDPANLEYIVDYWTASGKEHLLSMGVDLNKVPSRKALHEMIGSQIGLPDGQKQSLALVAYRNNEPIGHCNVNQIHLGVEAHMHLHIWNEKHRRKGWGSQMVKAAIPHFFERLNLQRLWCEPYVKNPGPNKTLIALGFTYVKSYVTIPGSINFEQEVHKYVLEKNELSRLEN